MTEDLLFNNRRWRIKCSTASSCSNTNFLNNLKMFINPNLKRLSLSASASSSIITCWCSQISSSLYALMSLRATGSRITNRTLRSTSYCLHSSRLGHETMRNVYTAPTAQSEVVGKGGGVRVTTVFKALLALGIGSTAYGL